MKNFNAARAVGVAVLVFGVLFLGFVAGWASASNGSEQQTLLAKLRSEMQSNRVQGGRLIDKALETLRDEYFMELSQEDQQKLVYAGVQGMLSVLRAEPFKDQFTNFYDPELYTELQTETTGNYAGIGILMSATADGQYAEVVTVFEGSGAKDAGLQTGDVITEIEGEDAYMMPLAEVAAKIKGQPGTKVTLRIFKPGQQEISEVTIERRDVHYSSITKTEMHEGNVGYIKIASFAEDTAQVFREGMESLTASGMKSLIIDLRDNPGGLVEAAAGVADCFVKEGLIVEVEARTADAQQSPIMADKSVKKYSLPVLIIVNENSASASEILASCLRDYGIAKLIGEKTFGKGVVQAVTPLEATRIQQTNEKGQTQFGMVAKSALAVVIGKYFTKSRTDLHGIGLQPDFYYDYQNMLAESAEVKHFQDVLELKQEEMSKLRTEATTFMRKNDLTLVAADRIGRQLITGEEVKAMPKLEPKEPPRTQLGVPLPPDRDKQEKSGKGDPLVDK